MTTTIPNNDSPVVISSKSSKKRRPADDNYGWVVVIAAAVGFSLITGLFRVSGLIYIEIIDSYGVTRAKASTIFMTARLTSTIATPIVTKLLRKFTHSVLICTGGFIFFFALLASAFATAIWQLVITYGFLVGVASQLVITPGILAISMSFKTRRALALSIFFTIGGITGLLIPFVYEILLEKFDLQGSFILYSGLMLNICGCGLFVIQPERAKTANCEEKSQINKSIFQRIVSNVKKDIYIFKNPTFICLLTCRVLIMMPLLNVLQFLPDFVEKDLDLGLSKMNIASLLSVTAIGDVCARILAGTVLDKVPVRKKYIYGVLSASVGVLLFAVLMVRSYALLLTLHIIFGLQLGLLNVTQYILEAELMSPKNLPLSFGITSLMGGLASVVMLFIVGFIRDVTGSYYVGFSLMGVSAILSGLFWLLEPCLVRCLPPYVEENANINAE